MKTQIGTPYEQGRYGMQQDILAILKKSYPDAWNKTGAVYTIYKIIEQIK